ncbi:MAG: flippase-like domain-containing protein [Actinobacteria bacterium]|nr:flippase-like domain-containing protein [Actinomycetota bacterium]
MSAFLHALRVFWDHLAAVHWELLAFALALHLGRLFFRAIAWRAILRASHPGQKLALRTVFGAYVAGVGVNSVVPARGGDVLKLFLVRRRLEDSSYATLAPTLLAETTLDFFVAGGLIAWALSIGVLPTHQVYSRLPTVDWKFFLRHEQATAVAVAVLAAAALIALAVFAEHGGETRARFRRGFAIFGNRRLLLSGVVVPQLVSWVLRVASVYEFLRAFAVPASLHNALLVQVVDSLATLFPATPGGAGTKQGLIVFLFRGSQISKSVLLAFSVGMTLALTVFNVVLAGAAIGLMMRTLSLKRLREQAAEPATGHD